MLDLEMLDLGAEKSPNLTSTPPVPKFGPYDVTKHENFNPKTQSFFTDLPFSKEHNAY